MRALLDVNALIALHDPAHVHHVPVLMWLREHAGPGWASCPLTQNGCLRIMSQPSYPSAQPLALVRRVLRASTSSRHHAFWPDDLSLLNADTLADGVVIGPRQLTDVYLLALARRHGGCLATLDARIPLAAVPGAKPEHLVTIAVS